MSSDEIVRSILNGVADHWFLIIIVFSTFFEFTKIPLNPITAVLNLFYKPLRDEMNQMKADIQNDILNTKTELKAEIEDVKKEQSEQKLSLIAMKKDSDMDKISRIKFEILEFSASIDNEQKYTRDVYRHIMDENKKYHNLIDEYDLDNGLFDEEYTKIKDHYDLNKDNGTVYF